MTNLSPDSNTEPAEGWTNLYGAKLQHYFRHGKSLCETFQVSEYAQLESFAYCPCAVCLSELQSRQTI